MWGVKSLVVSKSQATKVYAIKYIEILEILSHIL